MSTTHRKYDVFLSFRGLDTRRNFISYFYRELDRSNIRTFKDDKELESGQTISLELIRAIEQSRFAVVVVSVNYAASPWCLQELVKIMDLKKNGLMEVMPIFYGVEASDVRRQIGVVAEQFKKHEDREEDPEKVLSWRQALTDLANISGYCSSKWEDVEMIDEITDKISKRLPIAKPRRSGRKLEEIDRHMEDLYQLLDLNSKKKGVTLFGIWARGSYCRSALAKFLYQDISQHFQSHCFLESVKRISQDRHMSHLHEEFLNGIQGQSVSSKSMLRNKKVLLVADDVSKLEQLDALAEDFNCFGPGSIVIIATQDKQLLKSYGVRLVYEVDLLKFENDLLRQPAFKRIGELCRQLSFKKRDNSAAFESDVEILCSPRDEFLMQNYCKPLHAQ